MPSCVDVFPATYTTATAPQLCEQWAEQSVKEAMGLIASFVIDLTTQGRRFRQGFTGKTTGGTNASTDEEFYAMMSCTSRILRRKYHIILDYKILKKKRSAGQSKKTGTSYTKYDWSYSIEFMCLTDAEWEEFRCQCDDDVCVDHTDILATTQTPTKEEEENPI